MIANPGKNEPESIACSAHSHNRRTFLKLSAAAAAALGLSAQSSFGADGAFFMLPMGKDSNQAVDLGSGDTGILNYAYALEQLEAAFYTQVMQTPYANMAEPEKQILTDIRDHEIVHREFFKMAIGANGIPGLTPDFSKVKFDDRENVLKTAKTFEDLGVAAYNGAGQLLKNPDYLLIAGKIVSVEARHAAAISDLLKPKEEGFAPSATDPAKSPGDVLKAAGPFIKTKINAKHLPNSKSEEAK